MSDPTAARDWILRTVPANYREDAEQAIADLLADREMAEAERCHACNGRGVIQHGGYYVPGEQFVEPPTEDLCEDCLATGSRVVQEQSGELERLRARVAELEAQARQDHEIMREQGAELREAEREAYEAYCRESGV